MEGKNSGMDMQPEFDSTIRSAASTHYQKAHSAGEKQDKIRKNTDTKTK